MAYQHDVFISYKRELCWTPWTRDHFKKLLTSYLQQDLGRAPDIFVDERISVGYDWVDELGTHLATSRVLVGIFSADYFGSDWCIHELDLMIERSQQIAGAKSGDVRLIIPVIVHDGQHIPDPVTRVQPAHFEKWRIAYINEATQDYHEFSKAMGELSPHVAKAIDAAPAFETSWLDTCKKRFNDVFEATHKSTHVLPSKFLWTPPAPPTVPPRPTI